MILKALFRHGAKVLGGYSFAVEKTGDFSEAMQEACSGFEQTYPDVSLLEEGLVITVEKHPRA
jgi:hypothetical protein